MYHKFNNLRTVNSYGEFVWQICRRKGHPVAVISRNGRHYCDLKLMPGFGSRSMHDDVTEFVMDVFCMKAALDGIALAVGCDDSEFCPVVIDRASPKKGGAVLVELSE